MKLLEENLSGSQYSNKIFYSKLFLVLQVPKYLKDTNIYLDSHLI